MFWLLIPVMLPQTWLEMSRLLLENIQWFLRLQMFEPSLEQRSLVWQPIHQAAAQPPSSVPSTAKAMPYAI